VALSRFGDVPLMAGKGGTSFGQSRLYNDRDQIEPLPKKTHRYQRVAILPTFEKSDWR
jgi:hypothetical protein